MPSIGQILREAREKKGVSIPDVSHATRIKIDYLERMESDQFDRLIAPAYAKSFLKMYSEFLGLNAADMLTLLNNWQPSKSAAPAPVAPSAPRKPAMPSGTRTAQHPATHRPASPPKPRVTTPVSTTAPPAAVTPPIPLPAQTHPKPSAQTPPAATPTKSQEGEKLKLAQEKPKPHPPSRPPETIELTRGFPLKATLAVVVVITVILTAIVLLSKRRVEKTTDFDASELKATETMRSQPRRAADVLPVPPAP
jgi:hypothetical protein